MNTKPKLLLLDWDGTLASSHGLIRKGIAHVCEQFGRPNFTNDEFRETVSQSAFETFRKHFGEENHEKAHEAYYSYMAKMEETADEIEGAGEFLALAHGYKIPMSVVSFKRQDFLDRDVDYFGWRHYFMNVFGRDLSNPQVPVKPYPELLDYVLKHAKMAKPDPRDIWMVGDGSNDIRFAHNIGAVAIAFGVDPVFDNQPADHHFQTFAELSAYLNQVMAE